MKSRIAGVPTRWEKKQLIEIIDNCNVRGWALFRLTASYEHSLPKPIRSNKQYGDLPHNGNDGSVVPLLLGFPYHAPSIRDTLNIEQKITAP